MKNSHFLFFTILILFCACKAEQSVTLCTSYPSIDFNGTMYVQPKGSPGFTNTFTWQQAVDYCSDLDFDGCDDWYLPGVEELGALAEHRDEIGDFEKQPHLYWSSTHNPQEDDEAYGIQFLYGTSHYQSVWEIDYHRCRCVRR
ncbi:MAG: DUF1566 domain-containing protein [Saprospiraceae bacterium]